MGLKMHGFTFGVVGWGCTVSGKVLTSSERGVVALRECEDRIGTGPPRVRSSHL